MASRKDLIRTCKEHDEYCKGCPYVTEHGACTTGQPWKQEILRIIKGGRK